MESLADMKVVHPHQHDRLSQAELEDYKAQVPAWEVVVDVDMPKLKREFKFKNFAQALEFTNKVGALAEEYDHHPAILTEWGKVTVWFWTHVTGGLSQNDFIMAAKIDRLTG
jgi:4a-hydroxytetrahydrobiopterin dehydratase